MTILTVGIDLAKNFFAVHGLNEAGKATPVRTTMECTNRSDLSTPCDSRMKNTLIKAMGTIKCYHQLVLHNLNQHANNPGMKFVAVKPV